MSSGNGSAAVQERVKALRARVYEMRSRGESYEDIGRALDIPVKTATKYFERAVKLDGLPALEVEIPINKGAMAADPQAVGNVLALAIATEAVDESRNEMDKFRALHEACREAGLKPSIIKALLKRLRTTLAPVMEEGKKLTLSELTGELEKKISMSLGYMDHYAMSQASLKDLSINLSVLIEKHELLNNRPTQIIDFTSRATLNVAIPQLLAEAKRRGMTIESTAVVLDGPR